MGWLGSGSDYTVFVDHLGVPAVDIGFRGSYGVYHSIYDDFNWMEKFGDPEFMTHATAARLYTLIVMRAAAADVVPLKFVPYGLALREHVDELRLIHAQGSGNRLATRRRPRPSSRGWRAWSRPSRHFSRGPRSSTGRRRPSPVATSSKHDDLAALNDALARVERAFLLEKGLPGRPWFKHAIYAPGLTTGYACWPLPAIRQDLEERTRRGSRRTSA